MKLKMADPHGTQVVPVSFISRPGKIHTCANIKAIYTRKGDYS